MDKKRIVVLGSTGSIGTQALDVIERESDKFELVAITGYNNVDLLVAQAKKYLPKVVVMANDAHYETVKEALQGLPIAVMGGTAAVKTVAAMDGVDMVLTALIGYAGLEPTLEAIKAGKTIALANKETMVVAGELVTKLCRQHNVSIIPVDSEHSAIFQCLKGEEQNPIEKILLTASGGPFRGKDRDFLATATPEMALKHPSWDMGARITIASANMMNKGYEVIEARWLFDVAADQIEVLVHPQSVVHSAVQFEDGTVKAQLGVPDMRLPIQYAFTYPDRVKSTFPRLDFGAYSNLTFEKPDVKVFHSLQLAYDALAKGGNMACIMNAANEVAISAFLEKKIGFLRMAELVEETMNKATFIPQPYCLDQFVETNREARRIAESLV
ncbi:MAG: 1-deoxy-D-xylulose-5-phosphate reductoisomerase [Paludibacteraceae bacterium]|nr:1-deoxy-D-xylulose-5-phosphate reductoisomerase [Paludibacteraceae bacterium]